MTCCHQLSLSCMLVKGRPHWFLLAQPVGSLGNALQHSRRDTALEPLPHHHNGPPRSSSCMRPASRSGVCSFSFDHSSILPLGHSVTRSQRRWWMASASVCDGLWTLGCFYLPHYCSPWLRPDALAVIFVCYQCLHLRTSAGIGGMACVHIYCFYTECVVDSWSTQSGSFRIFSSLISSRSIAWPPC